MLQRASSILNYLKRAEPAYKWKVSKGVCPHCGKTLFIAFAKDPFLTRCIKCQANITNLSPISVIRNHFNDSFEDKIAYELSPYGSTLMWLKKNFDNVVESEYFPEHDFGNYVNGILNQDIQHLTFDSESFDVVSSNQVFEHVPDDIQGFRECFRVLKKGGCLVFTVPLYSTENTIKKAEENSGQINFLGTPEYHDSRFRGPKSSLVFWRHSLNDICSRVESAGFNDVQLKKVVVTDIQVEPSYVVYGKKPF